MKHVLLSLLLFVTFPAQSAETVFNPNILYYDTTSEGVLELWGVPEANGQVIKANPDGGWPSENTVALWQAYLMKAQEMNMVVPVGYDPGTLDIWFIGRPRPTAP